MQLSIHVTMLISVWSKNMTCFMQFHIVTKEIWVKAMILSRFFPCKVVDTIILLLCHLEFGSLAKYGIRRPANGPLYLKEHTPVYPVLDCGTVKKIKSGDIKVCGVFLSLLDLTYPRYDVNRPNPNPSTGWVTGFTCDKAHRRKRCDVLRWKDSALRRHRSRYRLQKHSEEMAQGN